MNSPPRCLLRRFCSLGRKVSLRHSPRIQPTDEELKASLAQLRDNAAQLDSFPLPMAAEPATIFKP